MPSHQACVNHTQITTSECQKNYLPWSYIANFDDIVKKQVYFNGHIVEVCGLTCFSLKERSEFELKIVQLWTSLQTLFPGLNILEIQFNLPPIAPRTEEQHFASSPLQGSLHFLSAAGEAKFLYAAGTQNTLPCVHPESGPYRNKMIIMKITCEFGPTLSSPLHGV